LALHVDCVAHILRAAGPDEGAAWRAAYDAEFERNCLLREQLHSRGLKGWLVDSEASDGSVEPDACEVDWAKSYEHLASCNKALEEKLAYTDRASRSFEDKRDMSAKLPVFFKVQLSQEEPEQSVELVRFFGRDAAFYLIRAGLPLGLKFSTGEAGGTGGAFIVEEVIPGGSAECCGQILPGDVLQALTVVAEGSDRSGWTDIMSSFVGGLKGGSLRQTLLDATFINSLDDLVGAIQKNKELGPDVELTLIFERNMGTGPPPQEPLLPVEVSSKEGLARDWTEGMASATRSTDVV